MLAFPTSQDITIEVNGQKLAVAQSYRARSSRQARPVEAFGEKEPVGTIGGRCVHQLELSRVQMFGDSGVDFHELDGFNVVIAKPDRRVIYSGCRWSDIDEAASIGSAVLEKAQILATKRMVLR
jgi:hypothetical protein